MINAIKNYYEWVHGQWPNGKVEPLPDVKEDGSTNLPGVHIVGDLTGIPLLKFASQTGVSAVKNAAANIQLNAGTSYDLIILGGGVSGYAAALEAQKHNLNFALIEANAPFNTVENFPQGKPIFTYPTEMTPDGKITFESGNTTREKLLDELKGLIKEAEIEPIIARAGHIEKKGSHLQVILEDGSEISTQQVIVAIGRSGKHRKLDVPGEDKSKVVNRLHDPKYYAGKKLLVVGGGDSALEAAIACAQSGAEVSLSYRQAKLSRPKADNVDAINELAEQGKVNLLLGTQVIEIGDQQVKLTDKSDQELVIENDNVLTLIGRQPPLDFFRKSNIRIKGETSPTEWVLLSIFFLAMVALYDWKGFGFLNGIWSLFSYPDQMPALIGGMGEWWQSQVEDRSTVIGTLAVSMKSRSFYYTLLYTSCIAIFGIMRVRRRKTQYVKVQTLSLFLVQAIPLFLLPELILPFLGYNGVFNSGVGQAIADNLFPLYISAEQYLAQDWPEWGHPRAYWHAYGLILAWPLNVYNIFTPTPIMGWLIIGFIQTFVIIPWLIYRFGKGAYCGWICSCGALAETMGDTQRSKMPHGPGWNKVNMIGQFFLAVAFILLAVRILGWIFPDTWMNTAFSLLLEGKNSSGALVNPVSWKWVVDILFGGILGVGLYFKYSGRVWCRFACPLASLMHIYSRFSRFRIFAEKEKCISCNTCTSVCHQGIDVMSFANQGKPMQDPQCVRCSACVQVCPTGVLSFGEIDRKTGEKIRTDKLVASNVQAVEIIPAKNI